MRLAVAAVILLLARPMFSNDQERGKHKSLELTVQKSADKTRTLPGSALYEADLINQSEETVMLQAVEIPDELAGKTEFFYCSLDVWKPGQRRWALRWSSHVGLSANSGPHLKDVVLKPGERVLVCSMMLPAQLGTDGECVRYRLRTRWRRDHSQHLVLSNPFVIGEKPPVRGSPCLIN
jgi:hypothetical protein